MRCTKKYFYERMCQNEYDDSQMKLNEDFFKSMEITLFKENEDTFRLCHYD